MENPSLDSSLPGVRHLQNWIRLRAKIQLQLVDGRSFDGCLDWQDPEFFALRLGGDDGPILIRRAAVALIRPLD